MFPESVVGDIGDLLKGSASRMRALIVGGRLGGFECVEAFSIWEPVIGFAAEIHIEKSILWTATLNSSLRALSL